MRLTGHIMQAVAVAVAVMTLFPALVGAEEESDTAPAAQGEAVFIEIRLSDRGVYALDTADFEWEYDFLLESFVPVREGAGLHDDPSERYEDVGSADRPVEERCTVHRYVWAYEKDLTIQDYEFVDSDIDARGEVIVKGWVRGDVTSRTDLVRVTATGQVDGDIRAPEIEILPGGVVLGRQRLIEKPIIEETISTFAMDGLIVVLSLSAFLLMFGFIVVALMPRQIANLNGCISSYPSKSFLMGLLATLAMPAAIVVVSATIVGIPLAPLIPIAYVAALVLGLIATASVLGRKAAGERARKNRGIVFRALTGIGILMGIWAVVAVLLGSSNDVSQGFGVAFLVTAIVISAVIVLTGAGAVVLTRFGFREYTAVKDRGEDETTPMPAPPPIPQTPPFVRPPDDLRGPGSPPRPGPPSSS